MRRVLLALSLFAPLSAAEPFAVLTVNGDITLNGKPLRTAGAPNWPLDAGDELLTGTESATIAFPDGMRITLGPASRLVLQQCNHCVAQFYRGTLQYDAPRGSKAEICALGRPVRPTPGSRGSIVAESPDKILVRVAGWERVLDSGKCPCNLGAPWALPMSAVEKAAATARSSQTAPQVSPAPRATRPSSSSTTP